MDLIITKGRGDLSSSVTGLTSLDEKNEGGAHNSIFLKKTRKRNLSEGGKSLLHISLKRY